MIDIDHLKTQATLLQKNFLFQFFHTTQMFKQNPANRTCTELNQNLKWISLRFNYKYKIYKK